MLNITKDTLSFIFKTIKNAISSQASNNVGFYISQFMLTRAYPSPTVGMMAYVDSGDHLTYTIYRCNTAGTWTNTSQTITLSSSILGDLDYTPTSGSEKLVTSGGVYDADVVARKSASSIVPFAGIVSGATISTISVSVEDDGTKVFYDSTSNTFIYNKSTTTTASYVNNWLNRNDWSDESYVPYKHKMYVDTSTGVIYRYDGAGLKVVIPATTTITSADYDALTTKDSNTYYCITEE